MSRRIVINLVAFVALGVVLGVWAVSNVIAVDAIDRPYRVTAEFDTSPGLSPYFEVTYLGQQIGAISDVRLGDGVVEVELEIERDVSLPRIVSAAVRRKSAVGEPYVNLSLPEGARLSEGERLRDGDVIPADRTSTPLEYSDVFAAIDELVAAVDPDDLNTLVHELAVGLEGRTESIRDAVSGAATLTDELAANVDLLDALFDDLGRITDVLADHREAVGGGVDDLAALAETLRDSQADIDALLERGPQFGEQVASILAAGKGDLACTLHGLGALGTRLDAETLDALARLLRLSPEFLEVLEGIRDPSGFSRGTLGFNNGQPPLPVYDERLTLPEPPTVDDCPAIAPIEPAAGGGAAPVDRDEGTGLVTDGDGPAVTSTTVDAAERAAPGDVPDRGFPIPLGRLALLAVALGVAGAIWWFVAGRRRARSEPDL